MTKAADIVRQRPWLVAWLALAAVTAVAVIGDDFGVFAPDTKPELYLNPDRLLHRSLYSWQPDPHLGQVNYNTGILPVAAVMTALHATGIEPWLLQRLVMVATLLAGAWGTGRLVTELTGRTGAGPWLAGVVHAWHPWTVVGAATLPVRLPHAVLPWLLLATHRAIVAGGLGRIALAGLTFGAMAGINGGVVSLLFTLPILLVVAWVIGTRQAAPVLAVWRLLLLALVAVGVSLYWLLPSLAAVGSSAGDVLLTTEDPAAIGRLSPPSETLRGMGMWTSYVVIDGLIENPEQLRLLTSAPVVLAGFGLTALGITALLGAGRRIASLVAALAVLGVGLMTGLNGSGGTSPLGVGLAWLFDTVPAATAFRTTNKAGSFLVLGLALAIGAGVHTTTWRRLLALPQRSATALVVALVVVAAGPLLPAQLHPLQIPIPDYWFAAAAATDIEADDRLLFLPGNAQTRYVWGHRGVDDLDTALFDERHVVWRSTIPAGSAPATNLLTAFDLGLQLGTLSPESIPTHTRLIGAGDAIVRTDTDWLRNFGGPTAEIRHDVLAVPGAVARGTFGPTAADRGIDPAFVPGEIPALTHVQLPAATIERAWAVERPLLVVGDAMAIDQLVRAGLDPDAQPLLYVDDLTDAQLGAALAAGGRVVLSDTNHRRSWAISSLTDSYSPLLRADDTVTDPEQRARITSPVHQTVRDDVGPSVLASGDPYGLVRRRAAGQPALAYDGNSLTGWQYGSFTDGRGGWLELVADRPGRVDGVQVLVGTGGKAITQVLVETDERSVVAPVVDGSASAVIDETTRRIRVTITETFGFSTQPATITEVLVDGDEEVWRPVEIGARLPRTLSERVTTSSSLRPALTAAPFSLLLQRLAGDPDDPFDDEEVRLRRNLEVPWPVALDRTATSGTVRFGVDVGVGCREIAQLRDSDATLHPIRVRPRRPVDAGVPVEVTGCGNPIALPPGGATFVSSESVTVDHLALGTEPPSTASSTVVPLSTTTTGAVDDDPTTGTARFPRPTTGAVLVSSGQAWHPGWRATADGVDLGPPVVAGGHGAGWFVPAGTSEVNWSFSPQELARRGQLASSATVGLALALLLAARLRRR